MKTIMKNKSYLSYNQFQLKHLSDVLCDDITNLLEALGVDLYKDFGKMIAMSCPVHGGDNESAFNLYHQGEHYRGNWKCRTHKCEETFKGSIIGFIRGCISHSKYGWQKPGDEMCSFQEALQFATDFTKQDLKSIKISKKAKEKNSFINSVRYIKNTNSSILNKVNRSFIRQNLSIPSEYFVSRGFSSEILQKYDIGECTNPDKEMYNRAVAPIYDNDHKYMIGCTGRSIFEKCENCKGFHEVSVVCPSKEEAWKYSKWKHSYKFKSEEHLYNFWFAKDSIKESSTVILVESPGNVWRLEEAGIHNSVAIFGSSLSDRQKMILDTSGAMTIFTLMDNDDAGIKAENQIINKCEKTYNIKKIPFNYPDIGSMTIAQIQQEISPLLIG